MFFLSQVPKKNISNGKSAMLVAIKMNSSIDSTNVLVSNLKSLYWDVVAHRIRIKIGFSLVVYSHPGILQFFLPLENTTILFGFC